MAENARDDLSIRPVRSFERTGRRLRPACGARTPPTDELKWSAATNERPRTTDHLSLDQIMSGLLKKHSFNNLQHPPQFSALKMFAPWRMASCLSVKLHNFEKKTFPIKSLLSTGRLFGRVKIKGINKSKVQSLFTS